MGGGGGNDNSQISGFSNWWDNGTFQWAGKEEEMQVGENDKKVYKLETVSDKMKSMTWTSR